MKVFKTIVAIIILIFSTITMVEMAEEESGAGLNGAITGYVIFLIIAFLLIYTSYRKQINKAIFNLNGDAIKENKKSHHTDKEIGNTSEKSINETNEFENKFESLKKLRDNDVFSEEEYQEKLKILKRKLEEAENRKSIEELKNTKDYKTLLELKVDGILTQKEFDIKVDVLKNKILKKNVSPENKQIGGGYRITEDLVEGYYVIINDNLDYGYADRGKNVVIEPKYEFAFSFTDGLALVRSDGKFGFIDKNDNMVIPCIYDFSTSFAQGKAKVTLGYESYYIDKYGNRKD